MLSFIYRLMVSLRSRDEVSADMLATFEEARADARSRGMWSYFLFGIRELAGVIGSPRQPTPRSPWVVLAGWALVGLLGGIGASYLLPASYTSEGVLRLEPSEIPATLYTNQDALLSTGDTDGRGLDSLRQSVTSRGKLTGVITTYDLYRHLRAREPLNAIVERMRKAIHIEKSGDFGIRVAFTYSDYPGRANDLQITQKVVQELMARIMDERFRQQSNRVFQAVDFFQTRSGEAAAEWENLNRSVRGLPPADPHFDRLMLDRELARKDYESLRQKLAEAQEAQEIDNRKQGTNLQTLDPALLPDGPDTSRMEIALYGFGFGLLVGIVAWFFQALRRPATGLLTPETSH